MQNNLSPSIRGSWENVSHWYDSLVGQKGQYFHQHVIFPNVIRLLEVQSGTRVLDLACGQGALSRELAKLKAIVTGVDASASLLDAAQKYQAGQSVGGVGGPAGKRFHRFRNDVHALHGPATITYVHDDARSLRKLEGETFDRIACILALQNIDPIEGTFKRVSELLSPGGSFVAVILHPAFRSPRITGWGEDTGKKLQFRRVDRYMSPMKIPVDMHPGHKSRQLTWTYHRPLQEYAHLGLINHLAIDTIEEWISDKQSEGKFAKMENLARAEIPMFMAIRYRKLQ